MTLSEPHGSIDGLLEHRGFVRSVALRCAPHRTAAEDLEQDAWVVALTSTRGESSSTRGWLARIVQNLARSNRRRDSRRLAREMRVEPRPPEPSPDEIHEEEELRARLAAGLEKLDPLERTMIELRFAQNLTIQEVARRLETTTRQVRTTTARGQRNLRRELHEEDSKRWNLGLLFVPPWLRRGRLPVALRLATLLVIPAGILLWTGVQLFGGGGTPLEAAELGLAGGSVDAGPEATGHPASSPVPDRDVSVALAQPTVEDPTPTQSPTLLPPRQDEISLSVRVTNKARAPIEGAEVYRTSSEDVLVRTVLGTTDDEGHLAGVFVGRDAWIGATHGVLGPSALSTFNRPVLGDSSETEMRIELTPPPRLVHGTVRGPGGEALVGVEVSIERERPNPPHFGRGGTPQRGSARSRTATTDAEGHFEMLLDANSAVFLMARQRGYADWQEPFRYPKPGQKIEIELQEGATLTGMIAASSGGPAALVDVEALLPGGRRVKTTTDERGHYRLDGLSPGTFEVMASGTTWTARGHSRTCLEVLPGAVVDWSPELSDTSCIAGRVDLGAGRSPEGWWMVLEPEDLYRQTAAEGIFVCRSGGRRTRLDAAGRFAFSGCGSGTFHLALYDSPPDVRVDGDYPWARLLVSGVTPGLESMHLSLPEVPPATAGLAGVLDTESKRLRRRAEILATSPGSMRTLEIPIDPDDGSFHLDGLPAGDYFLMAWVAGRAPVSLGDAARVHLEPGEVRDLGALAVPEPGTLIFHFTWPDEEVRLKRGLLQLTSETGKRLTFQIQNLRAAGGMDGDSLTISKLEPGRYHVQATRKWIVRAVHEVEVKSGEPTEVEIDLGAAEEVAFELARGRGFGAQEWIKISIETLSGHEVREFRFQPADGGGPTTRHDAHLPVGEYLATLICLGTTPLEKRIGVSSAGPTSVVRFELD